jgi:N-acetyl-anhydromuramyl-L-alanine amidase AmpD
MIQLVFKYRDERWVHGIISETHDFLKQTGAAFKDYTTGGKGNKAWVLLYSRYVERTEAYTHAQVNHYMSGRTQVNLRLFAKLRANARAHLHLLITHAHKYIEYIHTQLQAHHAGKLRADVGKRLFRAKLV